MKKLNLGCNNDWRKGYLNIDILDIRPSLSGEFEDIQKDYPFLCWDVKDLDFLPDKSVDKIVATDLLEHFEYPQDALTEWVRVLKIGGYLLLSCPDYKSIVRYLYSLLEEPQQAWKNAVEDYALWSSFFGSGSLEKGSNHMYLTDIDGIIEWFDTCGMDIHSIEYISKPKPPDDFNFTILVKKIKHVNLKYDATEAEGE